MSNISRKDFDEEYGMVEGVKRAGGILDENELTVLASLINGTSAKKVMEMGVCTGGTAKSLLMACSTITKYIGVDVPWGTETVLKKQMEEQCSEPGQYAKGDKRFVLIMSSKGTHDDKYAWKKLGKFDFIFIDGDHSYEGVKADTELALKLIKKGGIIAWHDYNSNDPNVLGAVKLIDEINQSRGNHICLVDGTTTCYTVVI